jgi:threonine dehydratase
VCVPEHASPVKVAAIRRYGVDVRVMGHEPAETERLARLWAAEAHMSYISPYNRTEAVAHARDLGLIRSSDTAPQPGPVHLRVTDRRAAIFHPAGTFG